MQSERSWRGGRARNNAIVERQVNEPHTKELENPLVGRSGPLCAAWFGYCEKQNNQEQSKITDNRKIRSCLTQISCCSIESFCARERVKRIEKSERKRLVLENSRLKNLRERAIERKEQMVDRSIDRSVSLGERAREINIRAYAVIVGHWEGAAQIGPRKVSEKVRKSAGIVYRQAKRPESYVYNEKCNSHCPLSHAIHENRATVDFSLVD